MTTTVETAVNPLAGGHRFGYAIVPDQFQVPASRFHVFRLDLNLGVECPAF